MLPKFMKQTSHHSIKSIPQLVAKENDQKREKTTDPKYSSENGLNKKGFFKV